MAKGEKFLDVNGVEILRGDRVEFVESAHPHERARESGETVLSVGSRVVAGVIQRNAWDPTTLYVSQEAPSWLGGWGYWRVICRKDGSVPVVKTPPRLADRANEAASIRRAIEPAHLCGTAQTEPVRPVPPETYTRFGRERAAALAGNPKDAIGSKKAPACTVPGTVETELGLAMLEGALKYGRHNYRAAPVKASVYVDAARRHMRAWFDCGQDTDPDSGLSHLIKAAACLAIIRDTQICGTLIDDRPPPAPTAHVDECNAHAARLIDKYPNPVPPYTAASVSGHEHDPFFDAGPDHE